MDYSHLNGNQVQFEIAYVTVQEQRSYGSAYGVYSACILLLSLTKQVQIENWPQHTVTQNNIYAIWRTSSLFNRL